MGASCALTVLAAMTNFPLFLPKVEIKRANSGVGCD
jgi:hypothetical protein